MAPIKFDAKRKALYLDKIADGFLRGEAAAAVGIGRQTLYSHLRDAAPWRPGESLTFREAVEEAELAACEPVERALYKRAIEGDVKAITLWLTNRNRGRWTPAQKMHLVEHTGQVDHVLETGSAIDRIMALQARLQQRAIGLGHATARVIDTPETAETAETPKQVISAPGEPSFLNLAEPIADAELVDDTPAPAAHVSGCGGPECRVCRPAKSG